MPQTAGTISLERDTPELARNYEQAGIVQFHHGKFLIGPLALKAGEHVLDIGTGTGRLAEFVAGLVGSQGRVIGIDPLQSRIDVARLRQSITLTFETGHAEDLSCFSDGQFDAVYLNSVFHWVAEKDRALREIHRLLKKGGTFCFTEPHKESAFNRFRTRWYRHDSLFADNEESLDIEALKRECADLFEFKSEKHVGSVAYLLVLNSMIFRVPLWLKRIYSPAIMRLEKMLASFHSRTFSLAVICQWKKK